MAFSLNAVFGVVVVALLTGSQKLVCADPMTRYAGVADLLASFQDEEGSSVPLFQNKKQDNSMSDSLDLEQSQNFDTIGRLASLPLASRHFIYQKRLRVEPSSSLAQREHENEEESKTIPTDALDLPFPPRSVVDTPVRFHPASRNFLKERLARLALAFPDTQSGANGPPVWQSSEPKAANLEDPPLPYDVTNDMAVVADSKPTPYNDFPKQSGLGIGSFALRAFGPPRSRRSPQFRSARNTYTTFCGYSPVSCQW